MIPGKITGAGNYPAQNAFRLTFTSPLSEPPIIEAWDNSESYPLTGAPATVTGQMFTGTAGNGLMPMLYAVDTTGAQPATNWKPTTVTPGGAASNRLKGDISYMQFVEIPVSSCTFNLGLEVPSDISTPVGTGMDFILKVKYRYSGFAPGVVLECNQGSEAVPVWTEIASNVSGLEFADLNTSWSGTVRLTLPESGAIDAPECGVI